VLAEISQSGAWSPREARFAPGVADLVAADPEFSPEAMEDRASVAFWRWAMAMRTGDAKPLAGVASPEVIRDAAVARDGGQAWRYVGECGVGAVEIVGVVHEPASHAVLVEVRWSGTNFEARAGAPPQRRDRTGLRSWLLVFERAASAKSRIADSFSSAHCRGCGAPAEGSAAACNYCGEALSDVNNGWTLTRMTTRLEATGRVLCERLRSSSSAAGAAPAPPPLPEPIPVGLVAWAARVALTDGVVDAREREGLRRLAAHASIPAQRLDELIAEATAAQTELALPGDAAQARTWFDAAARLAVADGVVSSAETALLDRLAVPAHMAPADVRLCINRARAEVLQDARAALRRAASS
jgi:uncharacterized tellurite resistance protein B-like protein